MGRQRQKRWAVSSSCWQTGCRRSRLSTPEAFLQAEGQDRPLDGPKSTDLAGSQETFSPFCSPAGLCPIEEMQSYLQPPSSFPGHPGLCTGSENACSAASSLSSSHCLREEGHQGDLGITTPPSAALGKSLPQDFLMDTRGAVSGVIFLGAHLPW